MSYLTPRLEQAELAAARDEQYIALAAQIDVLESYLREATDWLAQGRNSRIIRYRISFYTRRLNELRGQKLDRFLELTFQDPPEILPSSYSKQRPLDHPIVEDQSNPFVFPNKPIYPLPLKPLK